LVPEKMVGQPGAAAGNTRADGSRRNVEGLGDFCVVHPDLITEHDGSSELVGKARQRLVELHAVDHGVCQTRSRWLRCVIFGLELREAWGRASSTAAEFVETGIGRNPVGPGGELRTTVELRKSTHDGHQCLLGCVRCVRVVAREPAADRVNTVIVLLEQGIECLLVAVLSCLDQSGVVVDRGDLVRLVLAREHFA
jgi:hypothetical protein